MLGRAGREQVGQQLAHFDIVLLDFVPFSVDVLGQHVPAGVCFSDKQAPPVLKHDQLAAVAARRYQILNLNDF